MLQNKKYPSLFQGGHFLPTTPYQVEISFKFHITYFLFVQAMKTPSPYNFSNNAKFNIPYAKLSYNIDFTAQQGKIGKKYTSSPSHVILNCLSPTTPRENNWQRNFAYLCKLSLLSLSFTIPNKQQCTLSYSVGVLLPPLKSPQQKPCIPPSKTINYDHSNCRHVVSF